MKRELEIGDVVRLRPYIRAQWWAPEEDTNWFLITDIDVHQHVWLARIPDGGAPRRGDHAAPSCHRTWVEKDEFMTAVYRARVKNQDR